LVAQRGRAGIIAPWSNVGSRAPVSATLDGNNDDSEGSTMIKIYDKENGAWLGTIDEEQLQFLIDQLEEESSEDQDYYVNESTLDILEEAGADPSLITMLRAALKGRTEMDIR